MSGGKKKYEEKENKEEKRILSIEGKKSGVPIGGGLVGRGALKRKEQSGKERGSEGR